MKPDIKIVMNKHHFTVFIFMLFVCSLSAQKITVNIHKVLSPVSPLFWGTNFLYWIEDDKSIADDKLAMLLKEINCPILRYPGGTAADNYFWKTGTLDNTFLYPYESGAAETDFEEFMTFCHKVGAEPMLVVNTQSFFLKGKVDEGAQYAADWVKYCRDKGYKVSYWEIGNETYWSPVMTAREYGALVVKYAKAMKQVDPDIIISANGNWEVNMVGTKERTDPKFLQGILDSTKTVNSKEQAKKLKLNEKLHLEKDISKGPEKWWDNVLDVCGNDIDMLSIHWYFFENKLPALDTKLNELKSFVTKKMNGKPYKWCLSEYNCNTENDSSRVVGFAEGLGRFLNAGFDVATFWPMRIGGMEKRSMFSLKTIEPQYPYQIFKLFSKELTENMVSCTSDNKVYAFASSSQDQITVVLSGSAIKKETDTFVAIPGTNLKSKEIIATRYNARISNSKSLTLQGSQINVTISNEGIYLPVLPKSFVVITIKNL